MFGNATLDIVVFRKEEEGRQPNSSMCNVQSSNEFELLKVIWDDQTFLLRNPIDFVEYVNCSI
jgi:hypothetical protein